MAKIEEVEGTTAEYRLAARIHEYGGGRPLFVRFTLDDWYKFEKAIGRAVSLHEIQHLFTALLHGTLRLR